MADISSIKLPDGTAYTVKDSTARNHIGNKSNPHGVTASQIRALPLSGGTMDGTAVISFQDSGNWNKSNAGVVFPVKRGGFEWYGQSDGVELYAEETGNDNLDLVLKFIDDNSNKLSIRNKEGSETASISSTGVFTGKFSGVTKSQVGLGNVANYDQSKAIKSISRSGTTFTATALDGTTFTFTQQDNNTTYGVATQKTNGLMSSDDKAKLDSLSTTSVSAITNSEIDLIVAS